jgi:hemerythrin
VKGFFEKKKREGSFAMNRSEVSPAAALAAAHRALFENLRQLKQAAESFPDEEERELQRYLEGTRRHLEDHFRFEEENGYMQAVLARAPHLERKVEHLRDEHSELRRSLAVLTREAEAARDSPESFRQRLREWVVHVRDHERRENLLVEDAFNCELAAED